MSRGIVILVHKVVASQDEQQNQPMDRRQMTKLNDRGKAQLYACEKTLPMHDYYCTITYVKADNLELGVGEIYKLMVIHILKNLKSSATRY